MDEKHNLMKFFYRLAICSALVVLFFSIYNNYFFLQIVIRTVLGFFIIYFLGKAFCHLWTALGKPHTPLQGEKRIDYILGELDLSTEKQDNAQHKNFPGQINQGMKEGLPDSETQAEIIRKMGWGEKD